MKIGQDRLALLIGKKVMKISRSEESKIKGLRLQNQVGDLSLLDFNSGDSVCSVAGTSDHLRGVVDAGHAKTGAAQVRRPLRRSHTWAPAPLNRTGRQRQTRSRSPKTGPQKNNPKTQPGPRNGSFFQVRNSLSASLVFSKALAPVRPDHFLDPAALGSCKTL